MYDPHKNYLSMNISIIILQYFKLTKQNRILSKLTYWTTLKRQCTTSISETNNKIYIYIYLIEELNNSDVEKNKIIIPKIPLLIIIIYMYFNSEFIRDLYNYRRFFCKIRYHSGGSTYTGCRSWWGIREDVSVVGRAWYPPNMYLPSEYLVSGLQRTGTCITRDLKLQKILHVLPVASWMWPWSC